MTKAENLAYLIRVNQGALKTLLDDLSDEESMHRGSDNLMHIRWQAGHLVYNINYQLGMLGCPTVDFPAEYEKLFAIGSEPTDNPDDYPAIATLRAHLDDLFGRILATLKTISDEALDEPMPTGFMGDAPRMNAVSFMCMHTFYHAGQIASLRRILGRPRSFR